jgi:hypothetical protein
MHASVDGAPATTTHDEDDVAGVKHATSALPSADLWGSGDAVCEIILPLPQVYIYRGIVYTYHLLSGDL